MTERGLVQLDTQSLSHSEEWVSKVNRLLQAFLSGKKETTLKAYRQDLGDFSKFLRVEAVGEAVMGLLSCGAGRANEVVLEYKNHMIGKGLAPSTINRRLSCLRSVVKLGRVLGLVSFSIEIPNERSQSYRDTSGPGVYSMRQIMDALDTSPKGCRDRAILRLLFDLALRRGEVVKLDYPEDIDLERKSILVQSKGSREKTLLKLPDTTVDALAQWIEHRGDAEGPLFTNLDRSVKGGGRISGRSIDRNVLKPLGERLGVSVSPHGIRHTAITEAVKAAQSMGIGLEEVMDFSRHRNIKTLLIYRDRERNVQGKLADAVSKGV